MNSESSAGAGAPPKKVLVKTFGCQMNIADTERMIALMGEKGMVPTTEPKDADLIIINGCSVREKAVHKAVSYLGEQQFLKRNKNGELVKSPSGVVSGSSTKVKSLNVHLI